jgi:hypothetical protein
VRNKIKQGHDRMMPIEEEYDVSEFYKKIKKVRDGYDLNDPINHYQKDITKLLRMIKDITYELKKMKISFDGLNNANKKLSEKKYKLIALLTTIDACLPEPCDPSSLPDDYQFEVNIKWGLIKVIRNLIKGR